MKRLKASYTVETLLLLPVIILIILASITVIDYCQTYSWLQEVYSNATTSIYDRFYKIQCAGLHHLMTDAKNGSAICTDEQKRIFCDFFSPPDDVLTSLSEATDYFKETEKNFRKYLGDATYQQYCTLLSDETEEYIEKVISATHRNFDIAISCNVQYEAKEFLAEIPFADKICKLYDEKKEYLLLHIEIKTTIRSKLPAMSLFPIEDDYRITVTTGRM